MRAIMRLRARVIGAIALTIGMTSVAGAQLANASTAATGLGGAFTARAQGYNAVYWNPANLAMPGNPGFSMTLVAVDGQAGIKPIDIEKIARAGKFFSNSMREQWMLDVEAVGRQTGDAGGSVTEFGLSMGSFAMQFSTKVASTLDLSPGGTEALLFGNAGRDTLTNQRHDLDLAGSALRVAGYTTGAVSYAIPMHFIPLPNFSFGVTGKYIYGHGLVIAQDQSSTISSDVNVDFPAVATDTATTNAYDPAGSGIGFDLGAAWTVPGFRFGVSMQNVVNTFRWDSTVMVRRHATALFSSTAPPTAGLDTLEYPYASAPGVLREQVAALKFKPVFAAGMSFDWLPRITVSADIRQQVGDGIEVGPKSTIGAGAELRLIPFLPLRGGVQMVTGGVGVSGGVGLHFAGFEAGVAGYLRKRDGATDSGFTLNVFSIRP